MRTNVLLCLQGLQVTILLLHDWVPVPPLNDVPAARSQHSVWALLLGTIVSSFFPVIGLALSLYYLKTGWPNWLYLLILAAYGFLFLGELEAWWIPYFGSSQAKRVAEYHAMYGNTCAFVPPRNGIRINTLHFLLHTATLLTLLVGLSHFVVP